MSEHSTGGRRRLAAAASVACAIIGVGSLVAVLATWPSPPKPPSPVRPVASAPPVAPARSVSAPQAGPATPAVAGIVAPALRAVADRSLSGEDRLHALVEAVVADLGVADVALLRGVLTDQGEDDTLRNEAANLLQRHAQQVVVDDCLTIIGRAGEAARFRSFAVQHLGLRWLADRGPEEVGARLRSLLDDRDIPVRRESLLALVRGGDQVGLATARRWLDDPASGAVLDLAIRIAGEQAWSDQIPRLRGYLADRRPVVRAAAITALGRFGDAASLPAIETAASDTNLLVASAATAALGRLAAGPATAAPPAGHP